MSVTLPALALLVCVACTPPRNAPPDAPPRIPPIARADPEMPEPDTNCVRYWPEARYRSYAYDHVVHLDSACHRVASCLVATSVTPKEVVVAVEPGEHVEVVTLRGAESPDFTPVVKCSQGSR